MPHISAEQRADLGPWRERWDELVLRQPVPSPFQRTWWLDAVAAGQATYLVVAEDDRLVGGLALGVRTRGGATVLTAPGPVVLCPDHLDVLAAAGRESEVVAVVADWFGRPGQRVLDVRGSVAGSLLARAVRGTHDQHDEAPYAVVEPGSDWLAGRSATFRRNVRRGRRKLEALGFTHRRLEPEQVEDGLRELRRLHQARPGREALLAELPRLAHALVAGAALGEARVDVLSGERGTIAVTIAFELGGRLNLYQVARSTAREHANAGTVLLAAVAQDAIAHGCHEVDLMRGAEDYKGSFVDLSRPLERVRAANGTWAGVQLGAEDAARRTRRAVSATLRSRGGSDA